MVHSISSQGSGIGARERVCYEGSGNLYKKEMGWENTGGTQILSEEGGKDKRKWERLWHFLMPPAEPLLLCHFETSYYSSMSLAVVACLHCRPGLFER